MSLQQVAPDDEWLPDRGTCPPWCTDQHAVALSEGCDWYTCQEHRGEAYEVMLHEIRGYSGEVLRARGVHWTAFLRQRPHGPDRSATSDLATIRFYITGDRTSSPELELTSGDARVMARQLLDLADRLDLWD